MTAHLSGLGILLEPLLAPEGWMGPALLRLEDDPLAARLLPRERRLPALSSSTKTAARP